MTEQQSEEPTGKGAVELSEEALDSASGGAVRKAGEGQKDFIKVTFEDVLISS